MYPSTNTTSVRRDDAMTMDSTAEYTIPRASLLLAKLEEACDRFESDWKAGAPPCIEVYLDRYGAAGRRSLLRELIMLDLEYRGATGHQVSRGDYRSRFPREAGVVSAAWNQFWSGQSTLLEPGPRTSGARAPNGGLTDRVRSLRAAWPFRELPRDVIEAFSEQLEERTCQPGQVLIRRGLPGKGLFVIVSGEASVSIDEAPQARRFIGRVGPGDVVGEMSLLTREPSTATVAAACPLRALFLSDDGFYDLILRQPGIAVMLSQLMAERLDATHDILVGRTIRGYEIRRCLGRGGMAGVYEVRSPRAKAPLALKMMSHRYAYDWQMGRRFQSEFAIALLLVHPHIVRMLEHFTAFNTRFIVMDLCPGGSLANLLNRERLHESRVRWMIGQLAAALDHAHRKGVVHRDLKPSNVLLDAKGDIKLADFGLARSPQTSGLTSHHNLLGTPRYMAPEQLAGETADLRADIYAFGLIAFELAAGRPVYPECSLAEQVERRASWRLPKPEQIRPGLSADLYEVLQQSLVRDPQRRKLRVGEIAKWGIRMSKRQSDKVEA